MGLLRILALATGLFGLQAALASPAVAAVGAVRSLVSLAPSPNAGPDDPACSPLPARSQDTAQTTLAGSIESKSAAILGGRTSRLELIAMQQAAPLPSNPMPAASGALVVTSAEQRHDQSLPGRALEPAAGGSRCPAFSPAPPLDAVISPGVARTPPGTDDFLASKRLPVSLTAFDAAWGRVGTSPVPRALSRAVSRSGTGVVTRDRIAAINAWTNARVRYVEDRELYGQPDFWATARMTLQRRAGDCEDIAIAKMQLLAAAGVRREDMFLTIARDLARKADHALLVIRHQGRYLLLDNATDRLLDGTGSHDYRPIMSFNTAGKWLHGY